MTQLIHIIRSLVAGISVSYLAGLALLLLVQFVLPPDYADLTRSLFSLGLFLSLLLLPLCLLLRYRRLSLLVLIAAVVLVLLYLPVLVSGAVTAPPGAVELRILTFNIQGPQDELDSLVAIIDEADADLVALQEFSPAAATRFAAEFEAVYPYQALHPQDDPNIGQAVLSRYPITAENYWRNEQLDATLGHLRVELDIDSRPLVLYNTHPVPPFGLQGKVNLEAHSREIDILLERALAETVTTILVGDFNMTDQFGEYHRISTRYVDAFREVGAGFGFSFPNGQRLPLPPVIRLDYVFYDPAINGLEARIWGRSGSSDHLPLYVRLALPS